MAQGDLVINCFFLGWSQSRDNFYSSEVMFRPSIKTCGCGFLLVLRLFSRPRIIQFAATSSVTTGYVKRLIKVLKAI